MKSGSQQNNNRYADAYQKGFKQGLGEARPNIAGGNMGTTINYDKSKNFQKSFTKSNIKDSFKKGDSVMEYTDMEAEKDYKNNILQEAPQENTPVGNGFIKGDNSNKVGRPGYSFLNPDLWNVPQQRAPVCHQTQEMERKNNSLDPAGFVFGGPSNVMEFHGVGSIMPKFQYKEDTKEVEEPKRI